MQESLQKETLGHTAGKTQQQLMLGNFKKRIAISTSPNVLLKKTQLYSVNRLSEEPTWENLEDVPISVME